VLLSVLRARPPCVDVMAVATMRRIRNIVIRAIAINLEILTECLLDLVFTVAQVNMVLWFH
jgi:hypothetical protein